jgi:hypothetical protein
MASRVRVVVLMDRSMGRRVDRIRLRRLLQITQRGYPQMTQITQILNFDRCLRRARRGARSVEWPSSAALVRHLRNLCHLRMVPLRNLQKSTGRQHVDTGNDIAFQNRVDDLHA